MPDLMDVRAAAEALGVSPHRVRQLIDQGELSARRIGRFWMLDEADVERRAEVDVPDGRPYAPRQVWRMADLVDLSGREAEDDLVVAFRRAVGPQARWQLRRYLVDLAAEDDPRIVSWRLRRRADWVIVRFAHPSARPQLMGDPRIVLSGAHAAAVQGHDLVPGDLLEAYVSPIDSDAFMADHGLVEVPNAPNVRLRVAAEIRAWRHRRGLPAEGAEQVAPALLVMADLSERDDARAQVAANEMWASLRRRLERLEA